MSHICISSYYPISFIQCFLKQFLLFHNKILYYLINYYLFFRYFKIVLLIGINQIIIRHLKYYFLFIENKSKLSKSLSCESNILQFHVYEYTKVHMKIDLFLTLKNLIYLRCIYTAVSVVITVNMNEKSITLLPL